MPLRLTVGLSQKVGQPNYGSLGATCQVEYDVPTDVLSGDPHRFQAHVQAAYGACAQAVADELARHHVSIAPRRLLWVPAQEPVRPGRPVVNEVPAAENPAPYHERWATPPQARAIRTLADKVPIDLNALLQNSYQVATIEELTSGQASRLIRQLQSSSDLVRTSA